MHGWKIMSLRERLIAVLLLATACGGSTLSTTPVLTGTPCEQYAQAWCAKAESCTNGTNITRSFGDMTTCIAREMLVCNDNSQAASTGDTSDLVEKCAQGMSGYSCTDYLDNTLPGECAPTGPAANGAVCAFNGQCATGFCGRARTAICGVCDSPPAAGDSCADSTCGHGQSCILNSEVTSLCEPYVTSGETCGAYSNPQCSAGLACQNASTTTPTGTCATAAASVGAPCGGKNSNIGCDYRLGLTCVSGACAAYKYVSDGMPCGNVGTGWTACTGGTCFSGAGPFLTSTGPNAIGVCKAFAADGAACDIAIGPECMTGARCITGDAGTAGTCTPPTPSLSAACK
jgi:hypothetical protein